MNSIVLPILTFLKNSIHFVDMADLHPGPDSVNEHEAIQAALHQNWEEAVRLNLLLLKSDKTNISVLNRLGFAYLQTGQMEDAKKTFHKVIRLDKYNQIAEKNLHKLETMKHQGSRLHISQPISPMQFLEEPGKTKIVECVNAAPAATLAMLAPGQELSLVAKNHAVEVRTKENTYIAALPDDISFRILKLLAGGNTYLALVKSITKNSLTIFLREISRGKRFHEQPSFATTGIYMPYSRKEERTASPGEQEESPEDKQGDE